MNDRLKLILILSILGPVLSGCNPSGSAPEPNLTLTALSASIARTATAVQQEDTSAGTLATAQAKATHSSLEHPGYPNRARRNPRRGPACYCNRGCANDRRAAPLQPGRIQRQAWLDARSAQAGN
jgi:hypothetical protein